MNKLSKLCFLVLRSFLSVSLLVTRMLLYSCNEWCFGRLPGHCYVISKVVLSMFSKGFLSHCSGVAGVFFIGCQGVAILLWVVATALLCGLYSGLFSCQGFLNGFSMLLCNNQVCSDWLTGGCYTVAMILWMVSRALLCIF